MAKSGYSDYINYLRNLRWKKHYIILDETNLNFVAEVRNHLKTSSTVNIIDIKCPSGMKMSLAGTNQMLYNPNLKDSYSIGVLITDENGNEIPDDTVLRITKEDPCADIVQLERIAYKSIKIKNGKSAYCLKFGVEISGGEHLFIYVVPVYNAAPISIYNVKFKISIDLWNDKEELKQESNTESMNEKITTKSLTEHHLNLINDVKNEYIDIFTKEFDDEKIIEKVKWMYKQYGLDEPVVNIFDTPQDAKDTPYNPKLGKNEDERLINEVLFDAWRQLQHNVDESLIIMIQNEIVDKLYDIYRQNSETRRTVIASTYRSHGIEMEKKYEIPILAMYDYFLRIGAIKDTFNKLSSLLDYIRYGIMYRVYHSGNASVVRNPNNLKIFKDEKERFHNEKGYALIWRKIIDNDYKGLNYVKGVYFEPELFTKIFIDKNISNEEILSLNNAEQKSVAIHYIGYDKFINDLNAKKLDEWKTKSLVNGNVAVCELYELKIDRGIENRLPIELRFVKVQDHSTGKLTVLGVPINKETNTAKGAVAWTFGMKEEDYCPYLET